MIKIKLLTTDKQEQTQPLLRKGVKENCEKYGIKFVDSNPDVFLVHSDLMGEENKDFLLDKNNPYIFMERIDCASLGRGYRDQLFRDNCLGVVKNTVFRDKSLYNKALQNNRYHTRLFAEKIHSPLIDLTKQTPLGITELDKIRTTGNTFGLYTQLKQAADTRVDFTLKRDIDISFFGTTEYANALVQKHRLDCIAQLKTLKSSFSLNRIYGKDRYIKELLNSKIVVSPWGYGEACFRDFEALYLGCVLLKPKTSYVTGAQDIYINNKYYVECEIDFSDLHEKVDMILQNWDNFMDMRVDSKNMLIEWWDIDKYSKYTTSELKALIK